MEWLQRPLPTALLLVLLWTLCRLGFLAHTTIPEPQMHDEFSYLLGADTFAHGRLANPSPPLTQFFESPHELFHPTYASKYPPGQAMFLALGQVVFGSPFYGVLIGNAVMLFTFCLMLYAWVPPKWALTVSVMFALILSPRMYWTTTYWGGSLAAGGGALVMLAIGIYRKRQAPWAGFVFALGALLLFWTRPYEGGVFTLTVLIVFAKELRQKFRLSMFLAAAAVLAAGAIWTAYDDFAVTGNPFLLPYILHTRQYDIAPVFSFLPLRPKPAYAHPRLAAFHGGQEVAFYDPAEPRWKLLLNGVDLSISSLDLSLRVAVLLTILLPVAWKDSTYRKLVLVAGVFLIALSIETFHQEHYSAPVWAALALMIALWAERAWNLRIRKMRVGAVLVVFVIAFPGILALEKAVSAAANHRFNQHFGKNVAAQGVWTYRRAALIHRLSALPQRQLIFVRYPSPDWQINYEWVYNSADIDQQRVILAHDLGVDQDRILLNHYPDRKAWLLTFNPASGQEHLDPFPE